MKPPALLVDGELPPLQWAVATATLAGEEVSGDSYVVEPFPDGVLVAAIDGLGHGPEAAAAARIAAAALRQHAGAAAADLIGRCHQELRGTRGVVVSLASFDLGRERMAWVGVGDVEGMLHRADPSVSPAREAIVPRGGVVGFQLPPLRVNELSLSDGDTLVFVTDGVRHDFGTVSPIGRSPRDCAATILREHGKHSDDALVVVARYRGRAS